MTKTGKVPKLISYLFSSLSFPLLLLILFSLSSSVSYGNKHDNLLISTYDFMGGMRKSSGTVPLFFMLSFIIITISLESGTSSSSTSYNAAGDHFDRFFSSFPLAYNEMHSMISNKEIQYYYDSGSEEEEEFNHGYDGYEEDNEDDMDTEEAYSSEDEDDDKDLERRIEEFIAKVNQKWREEWLNDRLLCLPAP